MSGSANPITGRSDPRATRQRLEAQVLRGIDAFSHRANAWVPRTTMEYIAPNGLGAQSRWLEVRRPAPPGMSWSVRGDKWILAPSA